MESSPAEAVALPDEESRQEPADAALAPTATGRRGRGEPVPAAPPTVGMVPEQVIWTCLKAVTLMFILIALVLVAESV